MQVSSILRVQFRLLYFSIHIFIYLQEEKKIMYYYPKNTDIDTKIKQIGLCEAICKFTE